MKTDIRFRLFDCIHDIIFNKEHINSLPLGTRECFDKNIDIILDIFEAWPLMNETLDDLSDGKSEIQYDIFLYKLMSVFLYLLEDGEIANNLRNTEESEDRMRITIDAMENAHIIEPILFDYYMELQREHLSYGVNGEILGRNKLFTPEEFLYLKDSDNRNKIVRLISSILAANVKAKCLKLVCQDRSRTGRPRGFAQEMRYFDDVYRALKTATSHVPG